jgi:hypothetical protein
MSQSIFEWIFSTLNQDATLAALWGIPAENPYSVSAEQANAGQTGKTFPYCCFYSLARHDSPIYGNPRGPGKTWTFSFAIFATGSSSAAGADQCRAIFNRIDDIFGTTMDVIGVQQINLVLGPMEHWFAEEKCYRIVADFRIAENLACLP